MMRDNIIEPGTLRLDGNRLSVTVHMPWYRALPLSSVCDLVLDINGQGVAPETIHWFINGVDYAASDLPPLHDQWWFVTDGAVLSGELSDEAVASLDLEAEQAVHVGLGIYIPYIDAGAGTLLVHEGDRKTLKFEKSAA
jgi:Domain of unknown function (DUF6379)